MDGEQFDQYVQALGRAVGRRGVLAGLGGLAAAGISEVAAKNKHKNQHRKRKGDKAHQQKGADPSCYQEHKIGWCHCQPQKHCNVICIDTDSTIPPVGHDLQNHPDDYECAVDTDCFKAAEGDSCPRLCGLHTQRFSQGFEKNTAGWFPFGASGPLTRVASGTDGITAASGKWFAKAPQFIAGNPAAAGSNFTRWGSYGNVFPSGGYTTELAIYLNPAGEYPDDTRFDYTSAINDPTCTFRRDFVFNVGYYTGNATCGVGGTESRYVISATTNSYRANEFPCDVTKDPIVITTAGWYTFRHVFYDAGDANHTLAVDLILLDAGGNTIHTWTLSDPSDLIGSTVGGNRYGWLPNQEFPFLAIDSSSYVAG